MEREREQAMNVDQVVRYLAREWNTKISVVKLRHMRALGIGPPGIRPFSRLEYLPSMVDAWVMERRAAARAREGRRAKIVSDRRVGKRTTPSATWTANGRNDDRAR